MRAIERDPSYAEAHVGLSSTLFQLAQVYRGPRELMQRAYDEALTAAQLDDQMAAAHGALGTVKLMWQWDWSGAETHLRRALEQNPSDSRAALDFALLLIATGQPEEAISVANRAVELDPLSVRALGRLGWISFLARRYDDAIDHLESTLELHPEDPMIHYDLAASLCAAGRVEDADAQIDWIMASVPPLRANPLMLASLAWARQKAGRSTEAAETVRRLQQLEKASYVAPTLMAWAHLAVGNTQSMFECLDRATEIHDTLLFGFVLSPVFDSLRSDPRFQDILRRMNFPES
jgi:tetratricopeptide (TPR) repeat protein